VSLSQKIVLAIVRTYSRGLVSWEVRGKENIPLTGPVIVVANHVHLLDPALLVINFPRWIIFMAKEELFRYPFLRILIRWSQAVSVRRKGTIKDKRQVLEQAKDILERGLVMGTFPEGKRSREGKLIMGKPGPAVIALRAGVPLLPVGIIGTERIKWISWPWKRPHIIINIGQPFEFPSVEGRLNRAIRRASTELMMKKIAALLPLERQGVYREHGD